MAIYRIALALLSGVALCACSSSYTFTARAYPANIAAHDAGWSYLATVSVQDRSGVPPAEPALKKCRIEVIDSRRNKLLSEVVQVRGGFLTPRIEWREGPVLLVGIHGAGTDEKAPLYQAQYYLHGDRFQKAPPKGPL